jgi:hypothetical protein
MNFSDLLKSLALDKWYKILIYLGGLIILGSLFLPIHGISSKSALFLGLSLFLIGNGIWKTEKHYTGILPPNAYYGGSALKVTKENHEFDLIGAILIIIGIISLIFVFLA